MTTDTPRVTRFPDGSYIDQSLPSREQVKAFRDEQRRRYLKDNPKIAEKLKAE